VGTRKVLVPSYPGITAALGLLTTDMVYEYPTTSYAMCSQLSADAAARERLQQQFAELEEQAAEQLAHDGISRSAMVLQRIADARYEGQGYELRVDCGSGPIDGTWIEDLKAKFHDIHEREYSRRFEEADVQLANVRVRAIGPMPDFRAPELPAGGAEPGAEALRLEADAWFRVDGELRKVSTRFYDRERLQAGNAIEGPAIITQFDSTTVVPPGFTCTVDRVGHLVITYSDEILAAAQQHTTAGAAAR
jgi:N-methylhydantoinase A/oxoprolinase/acetone carboxylase beta subunit